MPIGVEGEEETGLLRLIALPFYRG
jgi:hypothetical protein